MNNDDTSTMLGRAIALAARLHEKQRDKGGRAYILHPIRMMMRLRTDDEELMCIAVLHDVVEDHDVNFVELTSYYRLSPRVVGAISLLTHDPTEPYDEYVKRIATNRDAARVKLEDLRDNADITRLKGLREKDFERLEKYHRAFVFLRDALANMDRVGYR